MKYKNKYFIKQVGMLSLTHSLSFSASENFLEKRRVFNFECSDSLDVTALDSSLKEGEELQLISDMKQKLSTLRGVCDGTEVLNATKLFSVPGREGESFFIENGKIASKNLKLASAVSYNEGSRVAIKNYDTDSITDYEPNLKTVIEGVEYEMYIDTNENKIKLRIPETQNIEVSQENFSQGVVQDEQVILSEPIYEEASQEVYQEGIQEEIIEETQNQFVEQDNRDSEYSNNSEYSESLPLSRKEAVKSLQIFLANNDLYKGPIDGIIGKGTNNAIQEVKNFYDLNTQSELRKVCKTV